MKTDKYVFFWSEKNKTTGIFSQWYKADMEINGIIYNSCEQYMMHQKALTFKDFEIADEILKEEDPRTQKVWGRKIRNFNSEVWNKVCLDIVTTGNYAKFNTYPDFKRRLFETGNRTLVEASPVDPIWGVGLAENDPDILDESKWKGTNLLGISLMSVREKLTKK